MAKVDELREIVEYARSQGLRRVKIGDIELELGDQPMRGPLETPGVVGADAIREMLARRRVRMDDDLRLWHTNEELPSERAARLAKEQKS